MRKNILSLAALLLAVSAGAQPPAAPPAAKKTAGPAAKAAAAAQNWLPLDNTFQKNIKTGDIEVYAPVTGVTTAQDTYDIFAPFEGRVEYMQSDLFAYITPKTVIARMVSTEMAALLDASTEEERKQTERRWQGVYKYYDITPETNGILTNIYVTPKTRVLRGDRLFTVAKKVVMIGKNSEPLYSKLAKGMTAKIEHARDPDAKFATVLSDYIPLKGSPLFNRLWLEVTDLKDGIKIGEQFNGVLFVGSSSDTMLVPRGDVLETGGKRFLVTEIKTGLETAEEIEITGHSSVYLAPQAAAAGDQDGKTKKIR
ncbi:MAG: hypothetical protein A2X35_12160 [Elusimicrobia bacterium GWA2_61_42]|nr:MAG: hypothetical protein A2X35_12160 [Elusimicrobia bacterium GWA2_61_42]OGR80490.1 MAG: hypothetical protein A2X38_02785 [Elusimicrobia bacterium GWC2_61_25]